MMPNDAFALMLKQAERHLARRDDVIRNLIRGIGPCTLRLNRNRFGVLVHSIVAQQISIRAAHAIHGRLADYFPRKRLTATRLRGLTDRHLRQAGLSASKRRALRDLADKVFSRVVPLGQLHRLSDQEVVESLTAVYGIGRWTAQMFLIFCLGRPDVLPLDDYGLRVGVQRQYRLNDLPSRANLEILAGRWRPYSSIATWYMWRSLGSVPQSGTSRVVAPAR
jgi:DNA-3-methyladenine glycosylase II